MLKIEFNLLKLFFLISGVLSLFLAWNRIFVDIIYQGEELTLSFDFNVFGNIVRISLRELAIEADYFSGIYFSEFLLPGLLYLTGFVMSSVQLKINDSQKNVTIGNLGIIVMSVAVVLYVYQAFVAIPHMEKIWDSIPEFSSSIINAYFELQIGFYLGIATIGLGIAERLIKSAPTLKLESEKYKP